MLSLVIHCKHINKKQKKKKICHPKIIIGTISLSHSTNSIPTSEWSLWKKNAKSNVLAISCNKESIYSHLNGGKIGSALQINDNKIYIWNLGVLCSMFSVQCSMGAWSMKFLKKTDWILHWFQWPHLLLLHPASPKEFFFFMKIPKQNKELRNNNGNVMKKKIRNKKNEWKILNDPNHQRKTYTSTCATIQYWMAMVTTEEDGRRKKKI